MSPNFQCSVASRSNNRATLPALVLTTSPETRMSDHKDHHEAAAHHHEKAAHHHKKAAEHY
ncbi:hypothetical protein, partial [Lactobacillus crispatus]|uniref:hypothetical protein n=1 Tax=Lactobacillus crispatus TaxID=47770 RepID=UPI00197C1500